jgi:hypothetical protein
MRQVSGSAIEGAAWPVLRAAVAYATHPVVRKLNAKRPARIECVARKL